MKAAKLPLLLLLLAGCQPSEATMREKFRKELTAGGSKWEGMDVEHRKSVIVYKVADKIIGGNRFRFDTVDSGEMIRVVIRLSSSPSGGVTFHIKNQRVEDYDDNNLKENPGYDELKTHAMEFARVVTRLWPTVGPTARED